MGSVAYAGMLSRHAACSRSVRSTHFKFETSKGRLVEFLFRRFRVPSPKTWPGIPGVARNFGSMGRIKPRAKAKVLLLSVLGSHMAMADCLHVIISS